MPPARGTNPAVLQAIMAQWARTGETYQQRIDHIRGTTSGGLNGLYDFKATTVKDDATLD